jgi:hypothetical protein
MLPSFDHGVLTRWGSSSGRVLIVYGFVGPEEFHSKDVV